MVCVCVWSYVGRQGLVWGVLIGLSGGGGYADRQGLVVCVCVCVWSYVDRQGLVWGVLIGHSGGGGI